MAPRKRGRVLVREVLAEMRAGATILVGGSRCHATYFFREGSWWVEDFDEGHVREFPLEESAIRELIASQKEAARGVIRRARWRPFSEAFLKGGDPTQALKLLAESRKFGERFHHAEILEAFLRFPPKLDPKVAKVIRAELRGFTAYHTFMEAACWDRSPEVARKGVLFVDRLIEMVGVCPGCFKVRASFHEQAGDLVSALADAERELSQTPTKTWSYDLLTDRVNTLRGKLQRQREGAG